MRQVALADDATVNAMTVDVEDYFQVSAFEPYVNKDGWSLIPRRVESNIDRILQMFDAKKVKATFFTLGWVAERHPDWVARCIEGGHEIASHGYEHLFLADLGPDAFERDLERTERALESAGAPRPTGFRASTFTLTRETWWAFDILVRRGYLYDSSIHPVRHPVYGIPDFEPGISRISTEHGDLVEYPVSTWPCLGRNLPMGGGGYFRLLPGAVTRAACRGLERRGIPASIYLHPWEFDPEQPRYPAPWLKRFRHYLNLDRTLPRLEALLSRFRFGTMREVLVENRALDVDSEAS